MLPVLSLFAAFAFPNCLLFGVLGTPSHNHSPLNGAGVFITWHHVGSSKVKASPAKVLRALSSALLVLVCEAFCHVFVVIPARAAHYLLRIPSSLRRLFLFQLLSWVALFAHYVYFTGFTGEVIKFHLINTLCLFLLF